MQPLRHPTSLDHNETHMACLRVMAHVHPATGLAGKTVMII
jgi:hypothetical protein